MASGVSKPRRKLAAILMVDVSGFSRMMGRDEEGTTALIREFHTRTRSLIEEHEGWVVDTAGDSVFGEFDSVVNAVRCARALQDTQAAVNATRLPGEHIETRIGVHLGDVIVQEHHVYGDGVNVAARLQAAADPGGIYVSEAVYQQVHNKLDLAFEDLGVREFKNIEYPVHLFRVVSPGHERPSLSRQAPVRDQQVPSVSPGVPPPVSWADAFLHPGILIPLAVAAFLLTAPLWLPSTMGIVPMAGIIVAGLALGRAWVRRTGRRGYVLLAVGAALILGGVWASWGGGPKTGVIIGGVVTTAWGIRKLCEPRARTEGRGGHGVRRSSSH